MSKITTNRLDVAAMLTTKACCYLDATMEIVEISGVSQKIGQNWRIDKANRDLIHHDWFRDGTFLKVRSVAYVADNESDKSAMKAYMMINREKDTTLYNSIREYAETSGKLRTRLTTAYEILSSERNAHAIIIRLFFGYMVNDINPHCRRGWSLNVKTSPRYSVLMVPNCRFIDYTAAIMLNLRRPSEKHAL